MEMATTFHFVDKLDLLLMTVVQILDVWIFFHLINHVQHWF